MGRRARRSSSQELRSMLLAPAGGKFLRPCDPCDEVVPGVLLGDESAALSTLLLKQLKVTHVLNAAQGRNDNYNQGYVNTNDYYYEKAGIKFMGIRALDTPSFYMRPYFREAADFIDSAVRGKGRVLVHCQSGISRSAALVTAYLMIKKKMPLKEALKTIRAQRSIFPNQGFLSQLCDVDYELKRCGDLPTEEDDDLDFDRPVKDALSSPNAIGSKVPIFSYTNYIPQRQPHTKGGYNLSYPVYRSRDVNSYDSIRPRARSEERCSSPIREYHKPYYQVRASSVTPDTRFIYKHDPEVASYPVYSHFDTYSNPRTYVTPLVKNEIIDPYEDVYDYTFYRSPRRQYRRTYSAENHLSPRVSVRILPSIRRTVSSAGSSYYYPRIESFSYSSPKTYRTYETYVPRYETIPSSGHTLKTYASIRRINNLYYPTTALRYPSVDRANLFSKVY